MSMRILVALDGSAQDPVAFAEARRIAAGGAEIHLLHVAPSWPVAVGTPLMGMGEMLPTPPIAVGGSGATAHVRGSFPASAPGDEFAEGDSRIIDGAVQYLERYRRQFPGIAGQDLVRTGAPVAAILEVALTFNIDLIVMSTHARTGMARWFMGSVSHAVLRRSQLPVLLVRRGIPERPDRLRRILVPVDGTPESRAILSVVKPLAVRLNAEILLMEVVDPVHPRSGLEDVGGALTRAGAPWRALTVYGDPTEEILHHARSLDADLVAMSAPAPKGLKVLRRSVPGAVLARIDRAILLQNPVAHAKRSLDEACCNAR